MTVLYISGTTQRTKLRSNSPLLAVGAPRFFMSDGLDVAEADAGQHAAGEAAQNRTSLSQCGVGQTNVPAHARLEEGDAICYKQGERCQPFFRGVVKRSRQSARPSRRDWIPTPFS
jgi:hypothetical protein